jgi:hypothetical protein
MRQDAGALALHSVTWSAASAERIVPPRRSHRVDGAHSWKSISRRRFAKQMALMADDQRATTLDHAFELLDGTAVPERDPVLVTFDSRCSSACTPRLAATRCA